MLVENVTTRKRDCIHARADTVSHGEGGGGGILTSKCTREVCAGRRRLQQSARLRDHPRVDPRLFSERAWAGCLSRMGESHPGATRVNKGRDLP